MFRLVGRKGNEELLGDVPHKEFLDLAVCFHYAYQGGPLGDGTILVHNSHMEMWDTSVEELYALARDNTPGLFPWECSTLEDILKEMDDRDTCGASAPKGSHPGEVPMRVLSSRKRIYGAASVLYPGVLEKLALKWMRNLYILPSSIHEVILLEDTGAWKEGELREMIAHVNATAVAPEEVLSDSLYYYNFREDVIRIAEAEAENGSGELRYG